MANPRLQVDILANTKDFEDGLKGVQTRLKSLGQSLGSIGKTLTAVATVPLVGLGTAAIKMASDAEESLNKVRVAFGDSAGDVERFASTTLDSFGIARASALEMASLFGDMGTSMGLTTRDASKMSIELTGLAGDLASFKNINIDQAMTALAGVFTGETESLKRLGVVMTEVNLQAFAMSQGITKNIQDMTQAEKVNLRFAYIMESTKNAQGDFARTSDGAANQMRIFSESMKELGDVFGRVMLPAFTNIIKKVNEFVKRLGALDADSRQKIILLAGAIASVGPVLATLGVALKGVAVLMTIITSEVTLTIAAFSAFGLAIYYVARNWDVLKERVGAFASWFKNAILDMASFFARYAPGMIGGQGEIAAQQIEALKTEISDFKLEFETLGEFFRGVGGDVMSLVGDLLNLKSATDDVSDSFTKVEGTGGIKNIGEVLNRASIGIQKMTGEVSTLGKTEVPIGHAVVFKDELKGMTEEQKKAFILNEQMIGGFQRVGGEVANMSIATATGLKPLQESIVHIGDLAMEFTNGFANGLANVIVYGEKLGDMLKNLAKQMIASGIFKLISAFFTGGLSFGGQMVGGFLGKGGGVFGNIMSNIAGSTAGAPVMGGLPAMAGSSVNVGGEFTVKGTDLVMVLNRATSKTLR